MISLPRCRTSSRNCRTSSTPKRRSTTCCRSTTRRSRASSRSVRARRPVGKSSTYSGELTGVPACLRPEHHGEGLHHRPPQVEIPEGGAEGMIVTEGGRFGGYGLFLSKGELGIRPGPRGVSLQPARSQADGLGRAGAQAGQAHHPVRLQVRRPRSSAKVARVSCSWTASPWPRKPWNTRPRSMFPEDEDFDVGQDTRTGVA